MATKAQPQPLINARELTAQALEPAVQFGKERGSKTHIAAKMTEITGTRVTRQMVERWLNPDEAKRDMPSFGNAVLLLAAVRMLQNPEEPISQLELSIDIGVRKAKKAAAPR